MPIDSRANWRRPAVRRAGFLATAIGLAISASACGAARSHIQFRLMPAVGLRDVPTRIDVSGLKPHETVMIRALEWSSSGQKWSGALRFTADANGTVDSTDSLLLGVMTPRGRERYDVYPTTRSRVTEQLVVHGRVRASASVTRLLRTTGVKVEQVRPPLSGLYGDLFAPAAHSRKPAIVYLGGSAGGVVTNAEASLLAAHGYPVLSLAYFSEPGLPDQLRNIPLEYFQHAILWFKRQAAAQGRPVVIGGESYGGEAALLVGASYPHLVDGVVALVPADVASPAPADPTAAAWTIRGHPIALQSLIPVERITASVFAVGSLADGVWPSGQYVEQIKETLAGTKTPLTALVFPNSGHAVASLIPNTSTPTQAISRYGVLLLGGSQTADEKARRVLWARLLPWLNNLAGAAG